MVKTVHRHKKINKLISLFLSAVILVPNSVFAEITETDEKTENAIGFLTGLGIVDNWDANDIVERAEFVNAVIRCILPDSGAIGRNSEVKSDRDVFLDVPSEYWASRNISVAKDKGIVHGGEDSLFNPQGNLSYEAAMKIAVSAAGYEMLAEQKGGYPSGYVAVASEIDISDKVFCKDNSRLTKGEAALILRNMLDCNVLEMQLSGGSMSYKQDNTMSLLNKLHNVYNFSGIVVGTSYSAVDSTETTKEGTVRIKDAKTGNDAIFDAGNVGVHELLGRRTELYYVDDDTPRLIWAEFKSNQTVLRADGASIDGVLNEGKIQLMLKDKINRFDSKETIKKVKFERDINIIKNGVFCSDVNSIINILNNEAEENVDYIEFYDNNDDGKYDVMNIVTYYTICAEFILDNDKELAVTDRFTGKKLEIDKEKEENILIRYDTNGREDNAAEIEKGMIVSVSEGRGKINLYRLHISVSSESDTVLRREENMMNSESNTYILSNTLWRYIESNSSSGPSLNTAYEFGIDYKGRVASYKLTGNDIKNYFYIYRVRHRADEDSLKLRVFTLDGEHKEFICNENFRVDTARLKDKGGQYFVNLLENQLVEYKLNEDGEVTRIFLPETTPAEGKLSFCPGISNTGSVSLKYKGTPRVFFSDNVGSVGITANTKILHVPHEVQNSQGLPARNYCKVGTVNDFVNDGTYFVRAYQTNASSVAADILVHYDKDESAITSATAVMVVEDVRMALNSEDEPSVQIKGLLRGAEKTICSAGTTFVTASGSPVTVGAGDIIKMGINVHGDCDEVEVLYDYDASYTAVTSSYSSTFRTIRGSVYSYDKDIMYMVKNLWDISARDITPANLEAQVCSSSAKIVIYDSDEETLTLGSYLDLVGYRDNPTNYSRVVVTNSYAVPNTIVVYK